MVGDLKLVAEELGKIKVHMEELGNVIVVPPPLIFRNGLKFQLLAMYKLWVLSNHFSSFLLSRGK